MSAPRKGPRPLVILGATCYRDAEASLSLSLWLARRVGAEIMGLLVEDQAITGAAFATARLLRPAGAASRVTVDAMHRAFLQDARDFRSMLERSARAAALDWSFLHRQGRTFALLAELAGRGDFVMLGVRRTMPLGGEFVVIPGAVPDLEMLTLASALATERRAGVRVLAAPGTAAAVAEALRKIARVPVQVTEAAVEEIPDRLRRIAAAAVLIAPDRFQPEAAAVICDAARCPVILRIRDVA